MNNNKQIFEAMPYPETKPKYSAWFHCIKNDSNCALYYYNGNFYGDRDCEDSYEPDYWLKPIPRQPEQQPEIRWPKNNWIDNISAVAFNDAINRFKQLNPHLVTNENTRKG